MANEITVSRARKIEAAWERERARLAKLMAEYVAKFGNGGAGWRGR